MEYECDMPNLQDTNHQNKARCAKDVVGDKILYDPDHVDYINYNDRTEGKNNNVNDNDAADTESNESMYDNINSDGGIDKKYSSYTYTNARR